MFNKQYELYFQLVIDCLAVELQALIGVESKGYHDIGEYEMKEDGEEHLHGGWLVLAGTEEGDIAEQLQSPLNHALLVEALELSYGEVDG